MDGPEGNVEDKGKLQKKKEEYKNLPGELLEGTQLSFHGKGAMGAAWGMAGRCVLHFLVL